jgi:uncharacterized protein (DUF302 family)
MDIGYRKTVDYGFDEARTRIENELKEEGFGILTEIDVKDTLKKKLDVDISRYTILGACNPTLAHEALTRKEEVGVLLPCNVIVYENEEGKTVVSAMNVDVAMGSILPELKDIAEKAGIKLRNAVDRL